MMKKILCSCILLASSGSFAAAITAVNASNAPSGAYEIVFKNAAVLPTSFNTTSPASIVLDFPNTSSALANRETAVNQNGIYSVNVIPGDARTRAVINLAAPAAYDVRLVGSDVHVALRGNQVIAAAPAINTSNNSALFNQTSAAPMVPVALNTQAPAPINNMAKSVPDLAPMFHKNADKGGVLTFTLPSKDTLVSVKTEGASIVATISSYKVPKAGQKRLDVADYGSPVRYVDILPSGADSKIVLNMGRNAYEYVTYTNGNEYNIEIKRPSTDENAQRLRELSGFGSGKQYTGQPLSLNFQDIEVRAVLQIIAEFTNNNIVVSDTVVGNITLRLDNVPWDQALDIIMKTKGLAMRKVDRVIYIAPEAELNKMEIDALAAYKEKQGLQPSNTELIQLKYAKASDILKIILESRNNINSNNNANVGDRNEDSILSSKGSVAVDERTNSLMVTDIPENIQRVRDLIAKLDEPVRQVLIDSRLVITSDEYSRAFGSRFGISFRGDKGTDSWSGSGTLSGKSAGTLGDRLGVNLAPNSLSTDITGTNPTAGYGISILGQEVLVDLELRALQAEGLSEIVSSPRVVTQDGYKALISKGEEIPYSKVSDSGTETEFKDAKLSMEVTPRIAPNDRVSMEIHITKDDVSNRLVNGEPAINTNEILTKVEVQNGETIVLGGIYEQTQTIGEAKVPLLGDIPVIGNVFKNTNKIFNKDELLVFITPRIIDRKLTDTDKFSNLRQ